MATKYLPRPDPLARIGFDLDPHATPALNIRATTCGLSLASYLRVVCLLLARQEDPTDEAVKVLADELRNGTTPEPTPNGKLGGSTHSKKKSRDLRN